MSSISGGNNRSNSRGSSRSRSKSSRAILTVEVVVYNRLGFAIFDVTFTK